MGGNVVGNAVHLDFVDGAEKGLADEDGVFGAEVVFDLCGGACGLLCGGDDDGGCGLGLDLIYFDEDVGFFFFACSKGFAEGVGYTVGGDGFCGVGNCLSDGSKLGGV